MIILNHHNIHYIEWHNFARQFTHIYSFSTWKIKINQALRKYSARYSISENCYNKIYFDNEEGYIQFLLEWS